MKKLNILIGILIFLLSGCGTSIVEDKLDIDKINEVQEGLEMKVSKSKALSLPNEIRENNVSQYGDEGYPNEN